MKWHRILVFDGVSLGWRIYSYHITIHNITCYMCLNRLPLSFFNFITIDDDNNNNITKWDSH